jgi:hypothetical protein
VNFTTLSANATLLAGFKALMVKQFMSAAGVPASSVKITLSSGSVKVKAEITPPANTTGASLLSTMKANSVAIATGMVTALKALPGLSAVSGTLAVSSLQFTTVTTGGQLINATTTAADADEKVASGAADVKPAMWSMAMVMAAAYVMRVA